MSRRNWTVKEIEKGKGKSVGATPTVCTALGQHKNPLRGKLSTSLAGWRPESWGRDRIGDEACMLHFYRGRRKEEKKRKGGEGVMLCGQVPVMMLVLPLLRPWFRRPPWRGSGWFGSALSGSTLEMPPVPVGHG